MSTSTQPTADDNRIEALSRQVDHLATQVESLEDRLEEKDEEIEELEDELEENDERIDDLEVKVNFRHEQKITFLDEILTGHEDGILDYQDEFIQEHGCLIDQLCGESGSGPIADLEDDVVEEQKQRSMSESRLRKEINVVAEKAGVDVTDSDLVGEDKITRVMRDGPQAVESTVYPVHERACEVLRNVDRWGTLTSDKFGKRFTLKSPTVSDRLQDSRGETLSTTEVKRVFAKIEKWAQDSPRRVTKDFSGDVNQLLIALDQEE